MGVIRELATGNNAISMTASVLANMTAADTAVVKVTIGNGTKIVSVVGGKGFNWFSGSLIC